MPVRIPRLLLFLLVAATLIAPSTALAVAPDGQYRFEASGANQVIVVRDNADFGSFFGLPFICENGRRKPSGNYKRDCDLNIPGIGDEDGTIRGKFDRDGDTTTIKEVLKIDGKIRGGGRTFDFDYTWAVKAKYVDGDPTAQYKWTVKACADDNCSKGSESTDVPASGFFNDIVVETDWTLDLDVSTNGKNKISGDATVQTDSGQTINFRVKGSYDPATEMSKIKLKHKKRGATIKIKNATIDGGNLMTGDFKNKFLGNATAFTATSVPIVP